MNKTYEFNGKINSNNGIYEAFYQEFVAQRTPAENNLLKLMNSAKKVCAALTSATAKRLARVSGVVLSLIGIVGLAGGIQQNRISLIGGLIATAAFLALEYLCLRQPSSKK